jgi:RNA-directed DNA polymerase
MIDNLWNKFINIENLKLAWNKVMSNMGSPGIDKFTINDFQINIDDNLNILRKLLEDQNYEPLPLLKITIPKENQKERNILIPTIRDRIVQTAILNILKPIFEKKFS